VGESGELGGIGDGAAAEVFGEGDVVFAGDGCQFCEGRFSGEAFDVEVRAVDAEDEGGAWGEGASVVVG
jgi:hypothetical protein